MDTTKIFDMHKNGKLKIVPTVDINSKEDLSSVYSPGVAKVSEAIRDDQSKSRSLTINGKVVAVISDGSAVLGLGNIGAKAALPVMEGKAAIFSQFAGVEAFPIVLDTQDTEEIIKTIKAIAPTFVAINLEDISAPRCFEIEERLNEELDIPVVHDDQHGTAIVTLAALYGALTLTKKKDLRIVVNGAGAAGNAVVKLLLADKDLPIADIKILDSKGVVNTSRNDMDKYKIELAKITTQNETLTLEEAMRGSDIFIGVSLANLVSEDMVRSMNKDPLIFAMANPNPEIMPDRALAAGAKIVATGRSDFSNQVNNALAYPGVFKGLIQNRIRRADERIKLTAAKAIFEYHKEKLDFDNILPSILDKNVPDVIADAIGKLINKL